MAGASGKFVHTSATANSTAIEAGLLVSDVAQSWLRTSHDDYIYVVVRLRGQVISITMALDINEFDTGIAGSLTNPQYVLHPEGEGAVRGAGTAAIRALADHLSKKANALWYLMLSVSHQLSSKRKWALSLSTNFEL